LTKHPNLIPGLLISSLFLRYLIAFIVYQRSLSILPPTALGVEDGKESNLSLRLAPRLRAVAPVP